MVAGDILISIVFLNSQSLHICLGRIDLLPVILFTHSISIDSLKKKTLKFSLKGNFISSP